MAEPKRVLVWAEQLEEHAPNVYRLRILGEGVHLEELFWAHEFLHPSDPALVEAMARAAWREDERNKGQPYPRDYGPGCETLVRVMHAALKALAEFGKEKRDGG